MKATGTILEHAYGYERLSEYTTWNGGYAGYASASQSYAYVSKFQTPEFVGVSESVTFTISMTTGMPDRDGNVNLRYAICSSDANATSYMQTIETVEDENQLVEGTMTVSGISTEVSAKTFTIEINRLAPNTIYYLVLWGYDTTGVSMRAVVGGGIDHVVELDYHSGLVYIRVDGEDIPHEVFIDNGTDWDRYIVHIDNGTDWDQCG